MRSYKKTGTRKVPSILLGIVTICWVYSLVTGYTSSPHASEHSFALLREADVALRVTRELENKSSLAKVLFHYQPREETLEEILGEFEKGANKNLLDDEALQAYKYLKICHTLDPTDVETEVIEKNSETNVLWSWEAEVLRLSNKTFNEATELALEDDRDDDASTYLLSLLTPYLSYSVFLIGLPFIGCALRTFKAAGKVEARPIIRQWNWQTLLTIILGIGLVDTHIFTLAYLLPDSIWMLAPNFFEILVDGAWRFLIPVVLICYFITHWRHVAPLLGLDKAPQLKPILGMMSLVVIYNEILFHIFAALGEIPWATVSSMEDGLSGLIYALLSAVIFAPIAEEIIYRAFLYRGLRNRFSYQWAIVLSTLFFVLIHYYGWYGSLSVAAFGIAAVPLYMATRSLWTPIIYHALTNLLITAYSWPLYHGFYSL